MQKFYFVAFIVHRNYAVPVFRLYNQNLKRFLYLLETVV